MGSRRSFLRHVITVPTAAALGGLLTGCLDDGSAETTEEEDKNQGESEPKPYEYSDLELLDEDRTTVLAFTMGDWEECCEDTPYHWHFEPLRVRLGESRKVRARIKDRVVENVTFDEHELRAEVVENGSDVERPEVTEEDIEDVEGMGAGFESKQEIPKGERGKVRVEGEGDHVEIHGVEEGEAEVIFKIVRLESEAGESETVYEAPPFRVRVINMTDSRR